MGSAVRRRYTWGVLFPGLRWTDLGFALGSLVAGLVIGWSALGVQADRALYDFLLRVNPPPAQSSRSLILAFDDKTLAPPGGLQRLREPLAQALAVLARYEPKAVAIDLLLTEPGDEKANAALEEALAAMGNVILATHLTAAEDVRWLEPLAAFRKHAAALGHVHAAPDQDGVSRRIVLAKASGSDRRWALALEALRIAEGVDRIVETEAGLDVGDVFVPVPRREDRALLIRYAHPSRPVERLSLIDIIENPATAAAVRGRVVFVGVVVAGGPDQYLMTPYSYGQAMSGVEINANAYETLAHGSFLRTVPPSIELLIAVLTMLGLALTFRLLSGKTAFVVGAALLVAIHAAPFILFRINWVLPFVPIAAVTWLSFLSGGGRQYLRLRGYFREAEAARGRYQRAIHYVTHEMRTPLTTIQGSSELISRYPLAEEKRKEIAERIHTESVRLGRMVDMFLSVERLAAGQLELHPKAVPVEEVLRVSVERSHPLADKKSIQIQLIAEPDFVRGDAEFLEYACYNLLTNAVKYSPAHSTITVRADSDSQNVCISVTDEGYGMDEADLKNIFQRFYRTQGARESGERGTGLGLALVEEIVIQHGGTIEVESRLGEGSRFTLTLPRAAQPAVGVQ